MDTRTIDANRLQQAELYGRPLGEIVRDLTSGLGISQARLAEVLGMSAPMLSQLASGQRVKMGNPQAVARLQSLLELLAVRPLLTPEEAEARMAGIATSSTTITATAASSSEIVHQLRVLASPQALLAAAAAAEPHSPALSGLLRQAASHG